MKHTTLITGAGRRISAGIAQHLAAQGHDLVLHYRTSKAETEALAAALQRDHGAQVTLAQADLAQPETLTHFFRHLPPVTGVIHNASVYTRDRIDTFTPAQLRAHMAVHVEAPLVLSQGFLAQLPDGVQGNIIILGDGSKGWSVSPEFFTYAASRVTWESLIPLLAAAVAPGARANLLALGPTLEGPTDPAGLFDRLAARAPLKRTSDLAEVLAAIDFLLAAHSVTGQVLSLAGGHGLPTHRPA